MEYVYAAMLLHAAEKDIDEKAVGAVLKAAGVKADDARVKALVASLAGVDISEAMTQAVAAPAAAAPAAGGAAPAAAAEEAPAEEEEEEDDGGGFEGLGSLFGGSRRITYPIYPCQVGESISTRFIGLIREASSSDGPLAEPCRN